MGSVRPVTTMLVLLLLATFISGPGEAAAPGPERSLGEFTLNESEIDVKRKLVNPVEHAGSGILTSGDWSAWIDLTTRRLRGIAYDEQKTISKSKRYPRTVKGITIGSSFKEVTTTHGNPELFLTARAPFILKNSELVFVALYPSRGLWLTLRNQTPYSGEYDWRVAMIAVGEADVIEAMRSGAASYTVMPMTPSRKARTEGEYRSKFGTAGDLKIHDEYQFNLQAVYFNHVRSLGDYRITPLAIVPADENAARDLASELTPTSSLSLRFAAEAEKKTRAKFGITAQRLAKVIENTQRYRSFQFAKEVDEHNRRLAEEHKATGREGK